MSVVGFDFGNQNAFIAVARAGGIDVLINDYSLHATPAAVSFGSKNRQMGVAARQGVSTNYKNTVLNFKHLVGRKFDDPVVQKYAEFIPAQLAKGPDGDVVFDVSYMGERHQVTPQQVTAAHLTKLKQITEAQIGGTVSDVVISVPPFWTNDQRLALLEAGQIAGLNVLKVVNENTAVGIAYGIYKKGFLPGLEEKPKLVAFVDVGNSTVTASLMEFNERQCKVKASAADDQVGGLFFDNIIREHFRREFQEKYKIDAKTNPKSWQRLLDESEKIKKQMSANSTAIPLNIECFMNDIDVSAKLARAEFEEMAEPLFQRIRNVLSSLIQQSGIQNLQDISEVEIIGGSSRIPFVKQIITHAFNREPKTTLNADDVVARGAAMQCAILSPSVKVLEFNVIDNVNYDITIDYLNKENQPVTQQVYKVNDEFPGYKNLPLHKVEPFTISAQYEHPNQVPYTDWKLGTWRVNGVTKPADADYRVVKVRLGLNHNGIFAVSKAMFEEKVEEEVEEPMETQTQPPKEGEKQEGDKGEEMEEAPQEQRTKKVKKVRKVVHELPIEQLEGRLVNLAPYVEFERRMQQNDLNEKLKADAKNAVEEYVYSMRDKLCEQFAEFVTEEESEKFRALLTDTEDWLYGDGEEAERDVYEAKLAQIRDVIEPPISKRQREKLDQEEVERNLREAEKEFQAEQINEPRVEEPMDTK
ncbi:unnamed protein product [Bursaphelenchus okinawaensis]|uniref:Uncharacterized protein n=1 Tax=Bursaphelenchus okinawaensis TaxID=465554 RepID=A0A811JV51_9BILA|nr:unnamed protein product [Bursaphelenchus okinawaensis]CAG9085115.1 unnamed protein product [Bursaphelenchus okinawaensis]